MGSMIGDYIPLLIQVVIIGGFAAVMMGVALLLGKRGRHTAAKDVAYECGKDPIGGGSARFSVKFYLVAMLFILFDIEVVFFYAWAVVYREQLQQGLTILWAMLPFVVLFFVGEFYAWKRGALDWGPKADHTT